MIFYSSSEQETKSIAKTIADKAGPGDIYCLSGRLGAGKTVFAKGFAEGLGITAIITSPTFTIVNEYNASIPLYHFDVYRINSPEEMEDTGYDEYFFGDGICLVEWADNIKELIPDDACWIAITGDEGSRKITIRGKGYENISS